MLPSSSCTRAGTRRRGRPLLPLLPLFHRSILPLSSPSPPAEFMLSDAFGAATDARQACGVLLCGREGVFIKETSTLAGDKFSFVQHSNRVVMTARNSCYREKPSGVPKHPSPVSIAQPQLEALFVRALRRPESFASAPTAIYRQESAAKVNELMRIGESAGRVGTAGKVGGGDRRSYCRHPEASKSSLRARGG
jgi:hypothetical protein